MLCFKEAGFTKYKNGKRPYKKGREKIKNRGF